MVDEKKTFNLASKFQARYMVAGGKSFRAYEITRGCHSYLTTVVLMRHGVGTDTIDFNG